MNPSTAFTGIPIELLFIALAGLVSVIYWDLKRGQLSQQKKGNRRDILLARICEKLGIPWDGSNGD